MAWNIAGMSRRSRDAAVEAARRAGLGLDDWLDEAITDHAGQELFDRAESDEAVDDRLRAAAGRLERIAWRDATAQAPRARTPDAVDSVIDHFEKRLARAEAQAARAFESVARILERDTATRDSDRRALIDAVRRLDSIRANLTSPAQTGEARGERFPQPLVRDPKPSLDLKAAVSQIAMRRHEIEALIAGGQAPPSSPDPQTGASNAEGPGLSPPDRNHAPSETSPDGTTGGWDAAEAGPSIQQLLLDDVRALGRQLDDMRRERAEQSASGVDLSAMRAEIDAMRQSLADLAPRNAVVALEGAIRDLVQRVEMLRQSGQGESLLAPIESTAAEFRAALKAHDPQAAAAGLEREIRAIGGKIDSLAATAIEPKTFERIRQQTEEVRNLLASAALRTPPLERMERQIGDLADRVERLGASPAPHSESAEMASLLEQARRQLEGSMPAGALVSIERRLEQIATRLDQEIARPSASAAIDPGPFDDLARRIDSVRQSLEARAPAAIDAGPIEGLLRDFDARLSAAGAADAHALQSICVEIRDKLDRIDAVASPIDLNPVETLLRSLEAKVDASAAAPVDQEVIRRLADEVARRLRDKGERPTDLGAVAQQIDTIYKRVDALAAKAARADESQPALRELIERLREADRADGAAAMEASAAINAALDSHLAVLKAEQASADERTQSRLVGLQSVLETLAVRLASLESELTADDFDERLEPGARPENSVPSMGSASSEADALGAGLPTQRAGRSRAASADDQPSLSAGGEDLLIEPGAGALQRAREARELAQTIGAKTNPAVGVHIAAARRAAQAALAESSAEPNSGGRILTGAETAPFAARGVQTARAFYASHRRSVLLGVAIAIAATLAVRMAGVRAPFLQRSELGGQAFNTAKLDASKSKPSEVAGAARLGGEAVDVAPTASIVQPPIKPDGRRLAPASGPPPAELMAAIPPGISQSLHDAVAAGQPDAQYELAIRLFDGRGLPKDQSAAARWFEHAASLGLAPAQYRLGSMYEKGVGTPRDPAAAKRWYLKAAQAGNARAAYNLAVMDATADSGEPNYPEAVKWFRKAAELGVRDSQYNLAILFARGVGVEKDLGQSFLWFSLAAQQGDADAAKKRDEIAGEMDPAALASAVEALMRFKAVKPDPAANDVAAPPGGWDAKSGSLGPSPG